MYYIVSVLSTCKLEIRKRSSLGIVVWNSENRVVEL